MLRVSNRHLALFGIALCALIFAVGVKPPADSKPVHGSLILDRESRPPKELQVVQEVAGVGRTVVEGGSAEQIVAQGTTICVSDEAGRPIRGAFVSIFRGKDIEAGERTDESGCLVLVVAREKGRRVLGVRAEGFAGAVRQLGLEVPDQLTVVLGPGGTIEGFVRFTDGSMPGETVTVVASSHPGLRPGIDTFAPTDIAHHGLTSVTTQADGSFIFRGLRPDTAYALSAASARLTSRPNGGARYYLCGERNAEVVVTRMWGASITFNTRDGGRVPKDSLGVLRGQFSHLPGITKCGRSAEAAILAEESVLQQRGDFNGRTVLFAETAEWPGGPPTVDMVFSAPGLGTTEPAAVRLGERGADGFPLVHLRFSSPAPRWGAVRLHASTDGWPSEFEWKVRGTLILRSLDSPRVDRIPVHGLSGSLREQDILVAEGTYATSFVSYIGKVQCQLVPDGDVSIREGETTDLELRIPEDHGFIEFNVVRPRGGLVAGVGARLSLRYPGDRRLAKWMLPVFFSGESHLVGPLYPATYEAEVLLPFESAAGARDLEVNAGEVTSEWFVLDK